MHGVSVCVASIYLNFNRFLPTLELNKNQVQEAASVGFLDADLVCVTCLDKSSIIVISDTVTVTGGPPTAETGR